MLINLRMRSDLVTKLVGVVMFSGLITFVTTVIVVPVDSLLHYSTIFVIYCLPVVFILCGLGLASILIHSLASKSELYNKSDPLLFCLVSLFIGVSMIKGFWSYPF